MWAIMDVSWKCRALLNSQFQLISRLLHFLSMMGRNSCNTGCFVAASLKRACSALHHCEFRLQLRDLGIQLCKSCGRQSCGRHHRSFCLQTLNPGFAVDQLLLPHRTMGHCGQPSVSDLARRTPSPLQLRAVNWVLEHSASPSPENPSTMSPLKTSRRCRWQSWQRWQPPIQRHASWHLSHTSSGVTLERS